MVFKITRVGSIPAILVLIESQALRTKKFFILTNSKNIVRKPHTTSGKKLANVTLGLDIRSSLINDSLHTTSSTTQSPSQPSPKVGASKQTSRVLSLLMLPNKSRNRSSNLFKLSSTSYSILHGSAILKTVMSSKYNYYKDVSTLKINDRASIESIKWLSSRLKLLKVSQTSILRRSLCNILRRSGGSKIVYNSCLSVLSRISNRESRVHLLSCHISNSDTAGSTAYHYSKIVDSTPTSSPGSMQPSPFFFQNSSQTPTYAKLVYRSVGHGNTTDRLLHNPFSLSSLAAGSHQNNIIKHKQFSARVTKLVLSSSSASIFSKKPELWIDKTLIRFIQHLSGSMVMYQHYNYLDRNVKDRFVLLYKRWILRMKSYERSLGHRFFFEESLHILHTGFSLHDPRIILHWLRSMIKRISFWKTRSIFRFIKYLFNNYYSVYFRELGVKGFKVKLKGKISVAGTGRKRTILYRSGETSHSNYSLKVVQENSTVVTFPGVMGLSVSIFY